MKANPGGQIAPDEVIGRDGSIANLWEVLEAQSLVLSAARRMGKTSIIKKMQAEAPENKLPIYQDLEKVRSPLEFVDTVLQEVEAYLSGLNRTAKRTRQLLKHLGGAEIGGFKLPSLAAPHWKNLLTETIADLVENQDRQVILFWDEVPYMLGNIGDAAAMEVLDTLRSLRQTYPDVRMVFTGSIGLHHVVATLKKAGYKGEPINDMYPVDVPPLSEADATELACKLLQGENILTSNLKATGVAIAQAVDCIPFYIQHLVKRLKLRGGMVEVANINEIIDECLLDPLNPWKMEHYRERIDVYYNDEQRLYALYLLDILAASAQPLLFDEVLNRLRLEPKTQDKEIARTVLGLLERDYYIVRHSDKKFRFRYPLIKRYWESSRC